MNLDLKTRILRVNYAFETLKLITSAFDTVLIRR